MAAKRGIGETWEQEELGIYQHRKFREAKVSSAYLPTAQGEEVLATGLEPSWPSWRGLGFYASVGTRVLTAEVLGVVV